MIIPQLVLLEVQEQEFAVNTVLIEQGSPGTNVYVLSEGEVAISIGEREITRVTENGALFGEMSALLGKSRSATVTVTKPSKFYVLDDLLTFLRKNPELAILLLKSMAERVSIANEQLQEKKWWQFW